ncbi:hypothetical protein ACX80J_01265 [Arthrobacter sp. MDB2-24]
MTSASRNAVRATVVLSAPIAVRSTAESNVRARTAICRTAAAFLPTASAMA